MKNSFFSLRIMAFIAVSLFATLSSSFAQGEDSLYKTTLITRMTTYDTTKLFGTYEGILFCADCPGIKTTLMLRDDGKFTLKKTFMERDHVLPQVSSGSWKLVENGSIVELSNHGETFKVSTSKLELLDGERQPIPLSLRFLNKVDNTPKKNCQFEELDHFFLKRGHPLSDKNLYLVIADSQHFKNHFEWGSDKAMPDFTNEYVIAIIKGATNKKEVLKVEKVDCIRKSITLYYTLKGREVTRSLACPFLLMKLSKSDSVRNVVFIENGFLKKKAKIQ